MAFDALVTNAGRLRILAALAGGAGRDLEFIELRRETRLTDGNLASHARRLEGAGLIAIHKSIRQNKPVTSYRLTADGRAALESHVRTLMEAVLPHPSKEPLPHEQEQEDWVD